MLFRLGGSSAAKASGADYGTANACSSGYKLEQIESDIFIAAGAKTRIIKGGFHAESSPKGMLPDDGGHGSQAQVQPERDTLETMRSGDTGTNRGIAHPASLNQTQPVRSRNPLLLLAIAAALIACAVQSGELGSADTTHRLQSAHAFWTSEPPVFPSEFPDFGVHGRNGTLQSWYGIGQSLLLLPSDILGAEIEKAHAFAHYGETDPSVRDIVVCTITNVFLNVLTAIFCFRLLRQFSFSVTQATAGVLALLLATTHLHYTQNMMENNYIFLLTLIGFSYQLDWLRTGNRRSLLYGSATIGLNLLTRLTTGLDLLAAGLFVLLVLWLEKVRGRELLNRCRGYLAIALPVYFFFVILDRLYQFYRFGSFTNTYVSVVAHETLQRHPDWPKTYPFETPFHVGFFGAFFAPEKSIFLFDPLLILAILLAATQWKRFSPAMRAYLVSTSLMLFAYICFYARYTVWSGDASWGDRYVSTSVEFASLLAIPLLLRFRREAGMLIWTAGIALLAISLFVQLSSLAFWLQLEVAQMQTLGHPTFVIALRIKNIFAFAFGQMSDWGLSSPTMTDDPWDYAHITCWNFLPFVLQRVGEAPSWVVSVAFGIWFAVLAALAATLLRIRNVAKSLDQA
jgi:hypothetical protein